MNLYTRATLLLALLGIGLHVPAAHAQEQVFGTEVIEPGIEFTFLAAPQDEVHPKAQNLSATATDFHLEVLAGWTAEAAKEAGAVEGGFVPYLNLFAQVENEEIGRVTEVTLIPHINRSDNMHYARNITLPGDPDDSYAVTFFVHPPEEFELAFHSDWQTAYGTPLFEPQAFTYEGLQLAEVVAATRE